ncbi:MAG TPA: PHP domain-containing protein [Anaerolineales bacterium]|nr:PHP domain-containing protein [Anaerolineales bacterium]
MKTYRVDLHVHTLLSPCAEVEMIPPLIVQEALEQGIDLIAITDHNASANIEAVQLAAAGTELTVLPGIELQTREEVHSLCLFDTLDQINALQTWVDGRLPPLMNNIEYFGEQFVVDQTGDFIRREERLLLASADISLEEACLKVNELGGLFIPAHVNRKAYGLLEVLGLVPPDLQVAALEISRHINPPGAARKFPQIAGYPLIQNGDVHRLEEFLGSTELTMEHPVIEEISLALRGIAGRAAKNRFS